MCRENAAGNEDFVISLGKFDEIMTGVAERSKENYMASVIYMYSVYGKEQI